MKYDLFILLAILVFVIIFIPKKKKIKKNKRYLFGNTFKTIPKLIPHLII